MGVDEGVCVGVGELLGPWVWVLPLGDSVGDSLGWAVPVPDGVGLGEPVPCCDGLGLVVPLGVTLGVGDGLLPAPPPPTSPTSDVPGPWSLDDPPV